MQSVNQAAKRVLDVLTKTVKEVGEHAKIDNASGTFMAVHVECIGRVKFGRLLSVAHYFRQNGDMMRDPEVVFFKIDTFPENYFPVSYEQNSLGLYQKPVVFEGGKSRTLCDELQLSITQFCNDWMKNIQEQQLR